MPIAATKQGNHQPTLESGSSEPGLPFFPALRSDLEILPRPVRGAAASGFLIKDPRTQEVFEMEAEEYFLCQQLDGHTALGTVCKRFESRFGVPVPLEDVEAFVRQLDFQGLLVTNVTAGMIHYWDPEGGVIPQRRYPLFNPDPVLQWLDRRLWWCFSRPFIIASFVFIALGLYALSLHWTQLINNLYAIWRIPYYPLLILVGVFCVQVPHEFSHGLVGTHYGARVTEAGWMTFYHFIPKFYLHRRQTLAITTRDRSKLYWVFFVGLYCQLLLASLGIIGSLLVHPGGYAYYFWTALWSTAAVGFVHNSNIAHRRDLHFILSARLGIVDMRTRAVEAMVNWLFRRPQPEPLTRRERFWFRLYGLGAAGYYVLHGLVLLFLFGDQVTQAFQGAGLVLWMGIVCYVFQRPLLRALRPPVRSLVASESGALTRRVVRLAWMAAILASLFLPYPYETGGAFKVLPLTQTQIHAEVEGRIVEVFVRENDWVTEGQSLARIEPREYEKNLQATQEQLAVADAQLRLLRAGPKPEEVQKAEQEVQKAERDVREAEVRLSFSRSRADRYATLYEEEAVSRQDYENALRERDVDREELEVRKKTSDVAKAHLALVKSGARPEEIEAKEAEVRRLQTLVADYEEELRLTVLRSPAEGQVVTPYIDQKVGQYLEKGDLFATIVDARTVQIEVLVPEEEAPYVQQGARLKVVSWAFPDTMFVGTVLSVAPVAQKSDGGITAVRVLAEIPNPHSMLKADMTGYAKSSTEGKPVWDVLLRRVIRWFQVEFWYWLP